MNSKHDVEEILNVLTSTTHSNASIHIVIPEKTHLEDRRASPGLHHKREQTPADSQVTLVMPPEQMVDSYHYISLEPASEQRARRLNLKWTPKV
ncbi:10731_t:CDS:2 [Ambispora gerdemannii]|uniref:10731_t:CDS:1 n=1 Tax=Ambispora gerdemannii TaxID=144530 RepID=A0A9N9ABW2_9GLOM|nr:10731_t:CDS:2 [Ambispora gerdemannii]